VWVLFVLIGLLLLLIASGTYVFVVGCVRGKEFSWLNREELEKTPFGKQYDNIVAAHNWLHEHGAKSIYTRSYDGLKLHALWIPVENAKGTVLLVHGYRSTHMMDHGLGFSYYHDMGMNLLIPDQRSHGKSEGRIITYGVKESRDMVEWIDYHNRHFGSFPLILSGLSMGASTVLYLADEELPGNVKGIIADCGFTSPKEIMSKVFTRTTHLPAVPTIWVTQLLARIFGGFSLSEKNTVKTLRKSKLPILLIHGLDDEFVPCEMTRRAFDACCGEKYIFLAEGAGHGVSFHVDNEGYRTHAEKFLNIVLN